MDRRCSDVALKAKQKFSKLKKLSEEDFNRIKGDIEDILFLAKYT